jgi:hypothetical protein
MGRQDTIERSLLLVLSILSMISLIVIGFSSSPSQNDLGRGVLIAPTYFAICILGVLAAFYPSLCKRPFDSLSHRRTSLRDEGLQSPRILLNHHLPCDGFRSHEFKLVRRSFCVGCSGLVTGAFASSPLVALYFSQPWNFGGISHILLLVDILLVALGLTQGLLFDMGWRVSRFLLNSLFVFGVAFTLIGEDMLRRSLQVDSYILVVSLLWLYIRIRSSKLSHQRICLECQLPCSWSKKMNNLDNRKLNTGDYR